MRDLVTTLDERATVTQSIFDPLQGRGEPPKGWTTDAMLEGFILSCAEFPEPVLDRAFADVMMARLRATWPLPGEFRAACEALMADAPGSTAATRVANVADRTARAEDYAHRRMCANESALFNRAIAAMSVPQLRRWLIEMAMESLRAGAEPHVSEAVLDAKMAELEGEFADGDARWHKARPSAGGSLGASARSVVDRVRRSMDGWETRAVHVDPEAIEAARHDAEHGGPEPPPADAPEAESEGDIDGDMKTAEPPQGPQETVNQGGHKPGHDDELEPEEVAL